MTTATRVSRVRATLSSILIFLPSLVLVASAIAMFAHVPALVTQMAALGFHGSKLMIVAVVDLASAALFLVPKTRPIGLLFVSAYLGGAIAAHLGHGQPPVPPAAFLALIWIGIYLGHPGVLWRTQVRSGQPLRETEE